MADLNLSQAEADALLQLDKHRADDRVSNYPGLADAIKIPLVSGDGRESFWLDVSRARINLSKGTYQNRARTTLILARLDFGGAPHRNPDDEELPCPHLHLYREGYGDKWAFPVPNSFADVSDPWIALQDFMTFVNIITRPDINRGLFV